MARLSGEQVARAAQRAGFHNTPREDILTIAVAIAAAESGWNPAAHYVTAREDSRGLWQINVKAHPWGLSTDLFDPQINAAAAFRVYSEAGNKFTPWSAYIYGRYLQYLDEAGKAVGAAAGITIPEDEQSQADPNNWSWHQFVAGVTHEMSSAARILGRAKNLIRRVV